MEDIFDIKDLENFIWWNFIFYPVFIVFFIMFFYFILNKFLINNKIDVQNNDSKLEKEQSGEKYEFIIMNKLLKFEIESKNIEKSVFYFELNKIFRDYLWYLYNKNFFKSTLEEIKLEWLLSKKDDGIDFIVLFELSYNEEFSDWKTSVVKRKKILNQFIELLK